MRLNLNNVNLSKLTNNLLKNNKKREEYYQRVLLEYEKSHVKN